MSKASQRESETRARGDAAMGSEKGDGARKVGPLVNQTERPDGMVKVRHANGATTWARRSS